MKRKKKKSKEKAEKDRAARQFQRQEKLRRREEKLQRRAERREEEKKIRAEQGEPEVRKAERSTRKGNHCSEKVDAVILKVLGRSHKKTAPKSKDKKVKREEVAGPKWRHGMREERHEDRTGKGKKRTEKAVQERQPAEQPLEQQSTKQALEEKQLVEQVLEEKQPCVNVGPMEQPCFLFDVGPDLEADGEPLGNGDGAETLTWPIGPDCTAPGSGDEPSPPRQVRKNNLLCYAQILHCLLLHCKLKYFPL